MRKSGRPWHWKVIRANHSEVRAEQERNKSYRAVYHLKDKSLFRLRRDDGNLSPSNDGRYAIGSITASSARSRLQPRITDYYLVNTLMVRES